MMSLQKKYKVAVKCLREMEEAYEQLTSVIEPFKVSQWNLDASKAESERGEALDIYLLTMDKG